MTKRECIRCGKDLTDEMGVMVFISTGPTSMRRTDFLMCVTHGSNGRNTITADEEKELQSR